MMNRRFNYATIENGIVENLSVGGTDVTAADALTREFKCWSWNQYYTCNNRCRPNK